MRIVLVGTELAPVRKGAGAIESLLTGWASALAADHDVHVVSVADPSPLPPGVAGTTFARPADLQRVVGDLRPDVVVVNNRPAWPGPVRAPILHLLHNWPDAWALPAGADPARLVGRAGLAAVSAALAEAVASATGRERRCVGVVTPFVDPAFLALRPDPEPGLVVCPNRLLAKKGVAELVAAMDRHPRPGRRVLVTDYLSPWRTPTAEHRALRAVVTASATCELVPPPAGRAAMAALYARAEVVVCPSIHPEGLGLTAVEAQAAGVPVVSSGLGGLAEASLLPDLVADPRDPDALAAAVDRAAATPPEVRTELRRRIATRHALPASLASLLTAIGSARPPGDG
jgi:glycosyltransferase involved in cell wall biosynthesis